MKEKLELLVKDISNNKWIEIEKIAFGNTATDNFLKMIILEDTNCKPFPLISELYDQISSLRIKWKCNLNENTAIKKYDLEDEEIYGEINILSLGKLLNFDKKLEQWTENFEEEELKDLEKFRSFDTHDEFIRMGFFLENNILSEEMYYLENGATGFGKSPFNFKKYFDLLLENKGFMGWQHNVLFPDNDNAKRMNHYINQLFNK